MREDAVTLQQDVASNSKNTNKTHQIRVTRLILKEHTPFSIPHLRLQTRLLVRQGPPDVCCPVLPYCFA